MTTLAEQLRIDAEHVALVGGDRVAIAKCLVQAADRIEELEAKLLDSVNSRRCLLDPSGTLLPKLKELEDVALTYAPEVVLDRLGFNE